MRPGKTRRKAVAALFLSLAAAGCGSGDQQGNRASLTATTTTATPTATGSGTASKAPKPKPGVRVRVFRPAETTQQPFKPSVTASAGDVVQIQTAFAGSASGHRVTISIAKGPASALTVHASGVGAGHPHTASIRSAAGGSITLQAARYTCLISQTSFCGDDQGRETAGAFTLSLTVPVADQPVVVAATVLGG